MPTSRTSAKPAGHPAAHLVLALGSFDGVHLGHQRILTRALDLAAQTGAEWNTAGSPAEVGVITCYPLPAQFIHPDFTYVLTPLPEKNRLLVELGVSFIQVVPFDRTTCLTEPEDYVNDCILAHHPAAVVVGHDHQFGRRARGDVALLERMLEPAGSRLEVVPEFELFGAPVRSTRIRERLLLGDVRRAAELLGRPYCLAGRVVSGTRTGRRIGYPTINLLVDRPEKLVPADGVYAVLVDSLSGTTASRLPGVLNIGHRPTFRGGSRTIEAHLFDVELPATPDSAAIHLAERLRPERRFSTPDGLASQIRADIELARDFFRRPPSGITLDLPGSSKRI